MQSNFEKVIEFNKQFGITLFEKPQYNVFEEHPKLLEYRMNLIREEVRELDEALNNKDFIETIDALGDILYVVYGMGVSVGFNIDYAFVFESGETNFMKTSNYHKKKGLDVLTFNMFVHKLHNYLSMLEKNVKEKEYKLMVDTLVDMIFTTYTLGYIFGIDLDKVYDIVHKSNMSKLCNDEKSAQETVEWYLKNGPKDPKTGELLYKTPAYRKSYDDKYYVVYDKEKTKILKSIYYTEANFSELVSQKTNNKSDH